MTEKHIKIYDIYLISPNFFPGFTSSLLRPLLWKTLDYATQTWLKDWTYCLLVQWRWPCSGPESEPQQHWRDSWEYDLHHKSQQLPEDPDGETRAKMMKFTSPSPKHAASLNSDSQFLSAAQKLCLKLNRQESFCYLTCCTGVYLTVCVLSWLFMTSKSLTASALVGPLKLQSRLAFPAPLVVTVKWVGLFSSTPGGRKDQSTKTLIP